jgi:hypothetical protein
LEFGKVDGSGRILWWHDADGTAGIGSGLGRIVDLTINEFGHTFLLADPGQDDWPHLASYAP